MCRFVPGAEQVSEAPVAHNRKPAAEPAVQPAETASGERSSGDSVASRFPNILLRTHEDEPVRFYDDLVKDKIVIVNFMYSTCTER